MAQGRSRWASYFSSAARYRRMPTLYATVVGVVVLVALFAIGIWLTWLSLRDEMHSPDAIQTPEPDEPD